MFVDADKEPLVQYFEHSVRLLRPGGLLLCDNAFFHGSVVDPSDHSPAVEGVRAFNRLAATDPRVVSAVIPIRDGVVIAVKVAGMSGRRDWLTALYAAGITPASFLPDASIGRLGEPEDEPQAGVELVEDGELRVHPVASHPPPAAVGFLDGIQQWKVVGYDGVRPIAVAYVAAAVRRRGPDGRLRTALLGSARAGRGAGRDAGRAAAAGDRRRRTGGGRAETEGPPAAAGAGAGSACGARCIAPAQALERELGRRAVERLGDAEWLVVDGQLAVSAVLARHPRALGVIKSHGAQFLEGRHLERALTVPAAHRTSVFRVHGGHGRTEVDSWYLRLWPWEGRDLLLRIDAHRDGARHRIPEPGRRGSAAGSSPSARPLAAPDARFDRLLYPIHDVETYLRSRAPGDLLASPASRLPRTGT